eukprot:10911_1
MALNEALFGYLKAATDAIQKQSSSELINCLCLNQNKIPGGELLAKAVRHIDVQKACDRTPGLGPPYSQVFALILSSLASANAGDWIAAFDAYQSAYGKFAEAVRTETFWVVPVLHAMTREVRQAAKKADKATTKKGRSQQEEADKHVRACSNVVQVGFKVCCSDKNADWYTSKKAGSLFLANQMIMLYFELNTLKNCRNTIATLERTLFGNRRIPMDMVKKSQLVTYKFYLGRLKLFEDLYDEAEVALRFALQHCHRDHRSNLRRILRCLVPLEIYRGRLPKIELLQRHGLMEFMALTEAVKRGDLRVFNEALEKEEERFIRNGTYLVLERVHNIVYRNLLRRVQLVCSVELRNGKSQIIDIAHVRTAFKLHNVEIDDDEVECILANVIYRGFVKGYISHKARKLVMSGTDAFPKSAVIKKRQEDEEGVDIGENDMMA